jgi:hypothetical protein
MSNINYDLIEGYLALSQKREGTSESSEDLRESLVTQYGAEQVSAAEKLFGAKSSQNPLVSAYRTLEKSARIRKGLTRQTVEALAQAHQIVSTADANGLDLGSALYRYNRESGDIGEGEYFLNASHSSYISALKQTIFTIGKKGKGNSRYDFLVSSGLSTLLFSGRPNVVAHVGNLLSEEAVSGDLVEELVNLYGSKQFTRIRPRHLFAFGGILREGILNGTRESETIDSFVASALRQGPLSFKVGKGDNADERLEVLHEIKSIPSRLNHLLSIGYNELKSKLK